MKVWVLTIDGEDFDEQYVKVFSTKEEAINHLAEWCCKTWNENEGRKKVLTENDEVIARYFSLWEDEDYSIKSYEVMTTINVY